ncbi:MAG TPA: hypothetical protein VMW72_21550 [Sedimentisphaerales bacterium]|nr:hypothetical protein [Sedimentisphaerales bacterium]
MDYLTSGNSYVDQGTNLIALGAFLTSLGWYLLATHKKAERWLEKRLEKQRWFKAAPAIIMFLIISTPIIYGLRMVSKGGTLTTKGWNIISLGEQRNNLIQAVTQEWFMNCGRLESPPMKGEVYKKQQDGELIQISFPRFRSAALNAVLSSGLWDYGNQMDRKFLNTMSVYERGIADANYKFRSYEDALSRIRDPNEAIKQRIKYRNLTYERVWFKLFMDNHNQVGKLIWSDYKWAIQTQLPETYKLIQKIFQEKSTVSKSEESSKKK